MRRTGARRPRGGGGARVRQAMDEKKSDAGAKDREVTFDLSVDGRQFRIETVSPGVVSVDGELFDVQLIGRGSGIYDLRSGVKWQQVYLKKIEEHRYEVWIKHSVIKVDLTDERDRLLLRFGKRQASAHSETIVRAPMPGIVTAVRVKGGDPVQSGARLLILEAMKMENEIRSPLSGKIKSILVKETMTVEKDQALIVIQPA